MINGAGGLKMACTENVTVTGATSITTSGGEKGCFVLRINGATSTPSSREIVFPTGSPAQEGTVLLVVNTTATDTTLTHDFGSTTSLLCPNSADASLRKNGAAWLRYDATSFRWRVVTSSGLCSWRPHTCRHHSRRRHFQNVRLFWRL